MKNYKLKLPDKLKQKSQEILEYLLARHYEDEVFTAGACAFILIPAAFAENLENFC